MQNVRSLNLNSCLVFTKTLVYVIQREIDLETDPDNNFKSLVRDGIFGNKTLNLTFDLGPGLGHTINTE